VTRTRHARCSSTSGPLGASPAAKSFQTSCGSAKTRKLDFVLVSLDDPSEIKTGVPRFLRQMRAQMSAYLLNEDDSNAAISAVDPEWAGSMPATFLLDPNGQVVYKHLGVINPEELRTELEKVTEKQ
jgi:peroxiredoxin